MSFTDIEKDNLLLIIRRQEARISALHDSNVILLDRVQELETLEPRIETLEDRADIPPPDDTSQF